MNTGWIKLHRQIQENDLWLSEPFTKAQAWVDLILLANHQDNKFQIRGIWVEVKRGQLAYSELTLAKRWKWSRNKLRRFLKTLKTEQQIDQHPTNVTSIITILKYDCYQAEEQKTEHQTIQQKNTKRNTKRYTNKNVKNVKNVKKDIFITKAAKPQKEKDKPFSYKEQLDKMALDEKDERMWVIAFYWVNKNIFFQNREQYQSGLRRELRPADKLKGYDKERIGETILWLKENADFKWTLETVSKYIDEDLTKLTSNKLNVV